MIPACASLSLVILLGAAEHDLIQVGQPFAGTVEPGVAHHRVVIP